jgi:hypothetical protein
MKLTWKRDAELSEIFRASYYLLLDGEAQLGSARRRTSVPSGYANAWVVDVLSLGLNRRFADTLADCKKLAQEAWDKLHPVTPFRAHQRVRINYAMNSVVPYRYGFVVEDEGGPRVKVSWMTADGPKVARNVVLYHGHQVEQWIPRERLEDAR